jgi:alpha-N-arabinofuranosidase
MSQHNSFEQPHAVEPAPFTDLAVVDGKVVATLPPKSVVAITLE